MTNSIALFSFLILVIYIFYISRYLLANLKLEEPEEAINTSKTVTVVVPFRNEANNIEMLTKSLFAQDYPENLLEFIFIDDHSEDQSLPLLKAFCEASLFNYRVLSLTNNLGKKAALKKGVEASTSQYIVTCDADCNMNSKWVASMIGCLENNKSFVVGPVQFKSGNSSFEKLQETEFSAIMAFTSGAVFMNKPISCNGSNLGYSRALYDKIKPYDLHPEIASGDDVFFLFAIKKLVPNSSIGFAANTFAVVNTIASTNIKEFVNQRIRWAKKSKFFNDWDSKKFGLLVIGLNMLLLFLIIYSIFNPEVLWIFIVCFFSKLLVDYFLLLSTRRWNQFKNPLLKSFFLSLLYPFYILSIALLSLLSGSKWKGRNL